MKIHGFLNREYEPPAPFVKVLLVSENLNIRKFLDLCIDTGASSTIILDRDAKYLRLNLKGLRKSEKKCRRNRWFNRHLRYRKCENRIQN